MIKPSLSKDKKKYFKNNSTDDIIKHWGSIENFDMFIQKIKDDEAEVAKLAIRQFGSIEKYTEAMKHNLGHFSELTETQLTEELKEIRKQSNNINRFPANSKIFIRYFLALFARLIMLHFQP